jgi:hypothetical protein
VESQLSIRQSHDSTGFTHRCEVASPQGNQPPRDNEQFPNGKKRPKDRLVVSGQPKWQVDVTVVCAILCVATCQISQRATAPVHREDRALDQYQPGQNYREAKLSPSTCEGNRHNTSCEEQPNRCVEELYRFQGGNSFRLGFHKRSQFRRFVEPPGHCSRWWTNRERGSSRQTDGTAHGETLGSKHFTQDMTRRHGNNTHWQDHINFQILC